MAISFARSGIAGAKSNLGGKLSGATVQSKERSMRNQQRSNAVTSFAVILGGIAGVGFAVLLAGAMVTVTPRQAQALPKYAAQTHLPCGRCHINPAGGGPRTKFGKAFAANGHKLKK